MFFLPSIGTEIVYCRGVEHLAADMLTVRPTILTAVPRVLEVIRSRVLTQVARQAPWRQALFRRALEIGLKRVDGQRLTIGEHLLDRLLDRLVRAKVRARFGGRLKAAMSGGARLEPEVGRFFLALGLMIMQGYGQTEAGPVISANPPDAIRIDTVGRVLKGVDVRLAEDGEILVRGDLVMDGYWGLPDATAAVIRDGWLHTGDIGDAGSRRLSSHHRSQEGHDRAVGRRERLASEDRGHADGGTRDRPGGGRRRRPLVTDRAGGAGGWPRRRVSRAGGEPRESAPVGDRADSQARGGTGLHGRERSADANAQDQADVGDPRQQQRAIPSSPCRSGLGEKGAARRKNPAISPTSPPLTHAAKPPAVSFETGQRCLPYPAPVSRA